MMSVFEAALITLVYIQVFCGMFNFVFIFT